MSVLPLGVTDAVLRKLQPADVTVPSPVDWVQQQLGEFLWSQQQTILQSVREHRKTAVQSCHGIGKSYLASRAAAWWIDAHPPGEAMIITTAPSSHQVRSILWGELGKAHRRGGLRGYITRGQVPEWIIDSQVVGFGRKPADYVDQDEARTQFQGIHARYLLVILDEACGVPQWLWEATETLVTNEASRILAIGNPDDPTSHFARMCAPGSGWTVHQVSAFDTPAFTGEPVPQDLKDQLVSHLWVQERRQEWGDDSPLFISKVLGEFPDVADDVIITPRMVAAAHQRDLSGNAIADPGSFGMDIAEFGSDETVIYRNRGGMIRLEDSWRKQDVDVSRARAQVLLERDRWRPIQIDVVGIGAGVVRPLANQGFFVTPFNGGTQAAEPDRFVNRNAEAWWSFREALEAGLIDLNAEDLVLASQLQSRRWKLDSSQRRIRLETKEEMRKRGLPSPDRADAAILSYYRGARMFDNVKDVLQRDPGRPRTIAGDLLSLKT